MIRTLTGKFVTVTIKNGQFFIRPLKKAHKRYKESAPKANYDTWVKDNENRCFVSTEVSDRPLISVVVPAYNTQPSHFLAMVYSVVNQHYDNWELIIVNASDDHSLKQSIDNCKEIDTRITVVSPDQNLGIAGNTNLGLEHCRGEYIAFLDHDDLLHECALHCIASVIEQTDAGLVYSDEDKIKDDSSVFFEPFLKPRWSPDLFENVNYINHLTAIKTEYIKKVGGLRPKFDGAQDYDLLLRIIDKCQPKIEHIPRILYHWRAAKTSTANDFSTKSYVLEAGEKALHEHLERQGIDGTAKAIVSMPGFYKTLPNVPKSISIVIGPVDSPKQRLCLVWLQELSKLIDRDIQIELVVGDWLKKYKTELPFKSIHYIESAPGEYWQKTSRSISNATILCFGCAALPRDKTAISELVAQASTGHTVVSPFILSDKEIIDAGLVESDNGKQRLFVSTEFGTNTYYGYTGFVRNVAGLTLDIFAIGRENFIALTEDKRGISLTDVDLEKIITSETRLVVNPRAVFDFKDTLMQGSVNNKQYFNPQLTLRHNNLYVKTPSWGKLKDLSERDNVE